MIKKFSLYVLIFTIFLGPLSNINAEVRLKDISQVESAKQISLIGYGLVTGLNGTGDRASRNYGSVFTVQTISNMLERFGITVPREQLRTRNVAAVMVTGKTPAFGRIGTNFDVTVSSLGDATSLEGGILLMTPLLTGQGTQYAQAQGAISIGGFNIETTAGEKVRKNHALTGRIPGGATLIKTYPNQNQQSPDQPLRLLLNQPDFVTASRIADKINQSLITQGYQNDEQQLAQAVNGGVIEIELPEEVATGQEAVYFTASIETLTVEPDVGARVVINERTGTVVAGGNVKISEVMISHGSLTIHIQRRPIISQPSAAFSSAGRTVVEYETRTKVQEEVAKTAAIRETSSVNDLTAALNELGLRPRDIIAVFQAIKQAGALNAELIIM
ncbi:MAG: flagellar basal body P-ring protein FlgI [Candidatus Marinimicrobia bacterium]|nr:flagellar basal body P-ring protein FlgI [Candidatus Neomarinimicrobiota bacterium]